MKSDTFSTNQEAILDLLGDKLLSAFASAVRSTQEWVHRFQEELPELAQPLDTRGWANIIHDWLWSFLKAEVDQMSEVEIREEAQTRELVVQHNVRIRVKKIRGGAISSYPTQSARLFYEQTDQLILFEEFNEAEKLSLVFGYVWDPDREAILAATVSYPLNMRKALWVHNLGIEPDVSDESAPQLDAPVPFGLVLTESEKGVG